MPTCAGRRARLRRSETSLARTRTMSDPETRLAGLIEVVESLIGQLARHAGVIEELRSDMTHKQGIVTKIGGGDY